MKEFFGFAENTRKIEGFMSWQHILFVTVFMVIMTVLAVFLGTRNRDRSEEDKRRVLIWAAILIDSFEIFKIIICCVRSADPWNWLYDLPLFLCSIQLITIPLAAFSKGRIREAALDFVFIFGILGAVLGTYGAGNLYSTHPVIHFDPVVSAITHSISGFSSLYIAFSGMVSMKKRNIHITYLILFFFCAAAYIANILIDYNYMFLVRGDGTPYDIFFNLVNGHPFFYPACVILLFVLYIRVFYSVYFAFQKKSHTASDNTLTNKA